MEIEKLTLTHHVRKFVEKNATKKLITNVDNKLILNMFVRLKSQKIDL